MDLFGIDATRGLPKKPYSILFAYRYIYATDTYPGLTAHLRGVPHSPSFFLPELPS
jgi:hypothetical protein